MATVPRVTATSVDVTLNDEAFGAPPVVVDLARLGELAACAAVFLPADPPRLGRVAFWRSDGHAPPVVTGRLTVVRPHAFLCGAVMSKP